MTTTTSASASADVSTSNDLGKILTIDVDPTTNLGLDQAVAIVTAVYDDGSLALRVLGPTPAQDTVRNYVDETGAPFNQPEPDPTPASSAPAGPPTEANVQAMAEALSPADQAALIAALQAQATTNTGQAQNTDGSQTVTPPTSDATPNTASL